MADFQMHLWMVDEVALQISRELQPEILWIAAQGPDPFLFYRRPTKGRLFKTTCSAGET